MVKLSKSLLVISLSIGLIATPALGQEQHRDNSDDAVAAGVIGIIVGTIIGSTIDNDRRYDRHYRRYDDRRYYRDRYYDQPRYREHYCVREQVVDRYGRVRTIKTCR